MASIIGKTIKGQTYYYLREVARVDGRPKVISQRYLGKASDIEAAMAGATTMPDRTRHLAFGDLAAVWAMLKRLRVAEIVDEVVGPRRQDAAASVGTYIALAILNRVCDPRSKKAFSEWWSTTAGDRLVRLPAAALDHRRFWEAMEKISESDLAKIERRIVLLMVETFGIDLSGLVLDMTNFATWIDSANDRAPIAQRGHSKQKRSDLRLVGLGLVVSTDGGVPLVSHAYPGNLPDVTQFPLMVNELASRFASLSSESEPARRLTLVFDAGQNSEENYALFEQEGAPFHFVGSLPPSDHPDLLAIPRTSYQSVDPERFPGLSAYETRKVVFGIERRIVLTHSETLHAKQSAGFEQTLAKARRQLSAVAARLARGRCRKTRDKVEAEIEAILKARWVGRVISTRLSGEAPAELRLSYRTKPAARAALEEELFGKRVLLSDKRVEEADTATIVTDYRSQEAAEGDFRQMKDPKVVSFSPMFHFTEHKIRVHVACCVLALMAVRLMVREAAQAGITLSVRALLESLAGIEETVLLFASERGRPKARRMLTEMDATQRQLFELFGLSDYAPRAS
ncbi:MAG TPA: IS1634 family transposase [Myxococcales bacterium]|nr:IS1634 family transposase [Myxococcales bacterium]